MKPIESGKLIAQETNTEGRSVSEQIQTLIDTTENDENIERILDGHSKTFKIHLLDRFIKLGVIGLLLVWGSVVLVKLITRVEYPLPADNDKDHYNDIYRLPDPYMTDEGLLKISFNNIRNETFVPKLHTLQWLKDDNFGNTGNDKGLYFTSINNTY